MMIKNRHQDNKRYQNIEYMTYSIVLRDVEVNIGEVFEQNFCSR